VHCGECDHLDGEVDGPAVQVARHLVRLAPPGTVAVSQTVRDLVVGSGIDLADHGTHAVAGLPDPGRVFVVSCG
jgi:class 3 adenylate cyclase